jgi:2-polyprenyl-6-methoxyphenol hydroxylase-like FAD-dependent oxidoreductase
MLPNFGQGAGMAIEDAAVLGVLFSRVHDVSEIPHRLKLFERARLVRVSAIQILSRLPLSSYSTEEVASEFRKFLPAEDFPSTRSLTCLLVAFYYFADKLNPAFQRTGRKPRHIFSPMTASAKR